MGRGGWIRCPGWLASMTESFLFLTATSLFKLMNKPLFCNWLSFVCRTGQDLEKKKYINRAGIQRTKISVGVSKVDEVMSH